MPQGSVVGPILFVLFSNNLPLHVTNSDVDIYADDSTFTFSSRWSANNSFMEKNINEEHVVNWSKMNKMVISQTKTKSVLAVGRRLRKHLDSAEANLHVSSNGLLVIEQVKSHKLLGIHKDQDLDFDAQSDALSKSFQRKLDFSSTLVHT